MSLNVANVKLVLGEELVEGEISIRDGRIFKISKTAPLPKADTTVHGKGLIAIPGLVDVHVHLRDMELSYKEDFSTGTLAAAAGGFTTVFDMPNTKPPTDSAERLRDKIRKATPMIHVNVGFYGSLLASPLEQEGMKRAGAIGFKLYMNDPASDGWHRDTVRLLESLKGSASLGMPVSCHAESGTEVARLQTHYQETGSNSFRDFMRAHSPRFELEAVRAITNLALRARCKIHVCHLSTRQALRRVVAARRRGTRVTCESTPHHLLLNQKELASKGGLALMVPPLRSMQDARLLWKSVVNGQVDVIASDHAPHTLEEKTRDSVWDVKPGIPGLETTLPLLLTKAHRGQVGLSRIVELLGSNPAKIFGLKRKGRLAAGMDADIVLIDPKQRFRIDSTKFHSKAHFSPFDGLECVGRPMLTIVNGHIVYDHGEFVETHQGKILTREA